MRVSNRLHAALVCALTATALLQATRSCGQTLEPLSEPMLTFQQATEEASEPVEAPEHASPLSIGGVETISERYPTGEVRVERQVLLDKEHNYVNHGPWKMFDRKGNVVAHGEYNTGKRTGVWTRWHGRNASKDLNAFPFNRFKAPFVSTVSFNNGVMEGIWMILDSEERKVRQVSIANGKRDGATVTWLPNGEVLRQATYQAGKPIGEVIERKKVGGEAQRVASYLNGRKVVSKTTNHPRSRQKKTEQWYLDQQTVQSKPDSFWEMTFAEFQQVGEPMLHGRSRSWHSNGQLESEGDYRRGQKVGRFTYWHPNGQKRAEGVYRDDQHEGLWVWWHDNGLKATFGQYQAGAEQGQWFWWQADGRLQKKQLFDGNQVRTTARPKTESNR